MASVTKAFNFHPKELGTTPGKKEIYERMKKYYCI
jgi:hypothetical protein